MNILAIGAHPDDVEDGCAGTLARYAQLGHKVFMATATSGNIGSATHSMEEIARIRKAEAAASAAVIGAEYLCLDYDDEMFYEDRSVRLAFINLVRYCKADVILTHNEVDYNPDHELTSKIVNDIPVMIPIAKLVTEAPPYEKIPTIYCWEPANSHGFIPTEYVDITDVIQTKRDMLAKHVSQVQWMKDNYKDAVGEDDLNFFDTVEVKARFRGNQCGVRYAEAFVRSNDAFRMTASRLLP